MEILFVNDFRRPDYLSDMIYHGLKGLWNLSVSESAYPSYMMKEYPSKSKLYGRGFTIYASMRHNVQVEIQETILQKITDKFYDLIIYGSINRCSFLVSFVTSVYDKKKIVFIDGEDECFISRPDLVSKGHYFKRELLEPHDGVQPISFSIPSKWVTSTIPEKTKILANVNNNANKNYDHESEQEYHNEYGRSYFGITSKKAGWDCLRHYEILANGCVPLFDGLDQCPSNTLTSLPKDLLIAASRRFRKEAWPDQKEYADLVYALMAHTSKKCTTVAEATRLIERVS